MLLNFANDGCYPLQSFALRHEVAGPDEIGRTLPHRTGKCAASCGGLPFIASETHLLILSKRGAALCGNLRQFICERLGRS